MKRKIFQIIIEGFFILCVFSISLSTYSSASRNNLEANINTETQKFEVQPNTSDINNESQIVNKNQTNNEETLLRKNHQHNFKLIKTIKATCKNYGCNIFKCSCGKRNIEIVEKTNEHKYDIIEQIDATCYNEGKIIYQCQCGLTKEKIIPKTDEHQFIEITRVEPTCAENGYILYKCECGKEERTNLDKSETHAWSEIDRKDATVKNDGYIQYKCPICGKTYKETIPRIIQKININNKKSTTFVDSLPGDLRTLAYQMKDEYYKAAQMYGAYSDYAIIIPLFREFTPDEMLQITYAFIYDSGADNSVCKFFPLHWQSDGVLDYSTPHEPYPYWETSKYYCQYGTIMFEVNTMTPLMNDQQTNVQKCKDIVETLNDGTDLEIVQQIFNYVDTHFAYNGDLECISELFYYGAGSCNAKSAFVSMCCHLCGIQCDIITGYPPNGGYHAWNRIIIDGKQTFWDATIPSNRNMTECPYRGKTINYVPYEPYNYSDINF